MLKRINRIFPDLESYILSNRLKQLKYLCQSLLYKDDNLPKREVIIFINKDRFENGNDLNIIGLLNILKTFKCKILLFCRPPSNIKNLEALKEFRLYQKNRSYLFYLFLYFIFNRKNALRKYWEKIFLDTSCKTVIAYQPDDYFCNAAKNLNIKTIELQHGEIYSNHIHYKNLKTKRRNIPDIFFCWDDYSQKKSQDLLIARKSIKIGLPELFAITKNNNLSSSNSFHSYKKYILVTLNHKFNSIYKFYPEYLLGPNNKLGIRCLYEFIIETRILGLCWRLRFHPNTERKEKVFIYNNMKSIKLNYPSIDISVDTNKDIMYNISPKTLHITSNSSVARKFSLMNIKSIVTCPNIGYGESFNNLLEDGKIARMKRNYTKEEFFDLLNEQILSNHLNNINYENIVDIYTIGKYLF